VPPFDAAAQQSWWRNKAPDLSERQRFFGVLPVASSTGEAAGPASMGAFFLGLIVVKKCRTMYYYCMVHEQPGLIELPRSFKTIENQIYCL